MILEEQRHLVGDLLIRLNRSMSRDSVQLLVVVNQNTIEHHCDICGRHDFIAIPLRSLKEDIVGLPFPWLSLWIYERWPLSIECTCLPIGIRRRLIRVQDLNFITTLEEDAAVATALAFASYVGGFLPLNMKLAIPKLLSRVKISCATNNLNGPINQLPLRLDWRASFVVVRVLAEMGQIFTVKKHDSVGRSIAKLLGRYYCIGIWAIYVVDVPLLAWKDRSVSVPILVCLMEHNGKATTGSKGTKNEKGSLASGT